MKKTYSNRGFAPIVIAVIVIVALSLGGGVYYSVKKNQNNDQKESIPENSPTPTPEFGVDADAQASLGVEIKTGTLRGLLSSGKDMVCKFTSGTASNEISGTMYISGSMMRGDFSSKTTSGSSVESHMIKQGDVVFVWSGNQGTKMGMSDITASNVAKVNSSVNLDSNVNYLCTNWNKDETKFSTPSNINFIDLKAMMNQQLNVNL